MYAVVGATGNSGSVVAKELLARGQKVRAIGRTADRLQSLSTLGAEPLILPIEQALSVHLLEHGQPMSCSHPTCAAKTYLAIPRQLGSGHSNLSSCVSNGQSCEVNR